MTDIFAMKMTLGGAVDSSYKGLNAMIIIGRVKAFIAARPNRIYATNLFAIMIYLS
ncbi:MAG: hypothetical protein ACXAC5_07665 [Promethearchaeota archaeon]|jgi:hypothetical protein